MGASLDLQGRDRSDVLAAFEVLSPSTKDRDLRWKRTAYTSLASLTHYVVIAQDALIAQDAVEVVVFATGSLKSGCERSTSQSRCRRSASRCRWRRYIAAQVSGTSLAIEAGRAHRKEREAVRDLM